MTGLSWDGTIDAGTIIAAIAIAWTVWRAKEGMMQKMQTHILKAEAELQSVVADLGEINRRLGEISPKVEQVLVHQQQLAAGTARMDRMEDRLQIIEQKV